MKFPSVFKSQKLIVQPSLQSMSHILIPDVSLVKNPTDGYWKYRAIEVYDWIGMASLQADRYEIQKIFIYIDSIYAHVDIYFCLCH